MLSVKFETSEHSPLRSSVFLLASFDEYWTLRGCSVFVEGRFICCGIAGYVT